MRPVRRKKKMENSSFSASNSTRLPARLAATVQIHCLRKAEEEATWPTNQSVMRRLEEGKGKKERHVRFTFSAYPFHCCVYLFFFLANAWLPSVIYWIPSFYYLFFFFFPFLSLFAGKFWVEKEALLRGSTRREGAGLVFCSTCFCTFIHLPVGMWVLRSYFPCYVVVALSLSLLVPPPLSVFISVAVVGFLCIVSFISSRHLSCSV